MEGKKKRKPAGGARRVPKELPTIEGLKFMEKIGQGHFSEVYNGIYKGKTPVAIKLIERGSEHLISLEIELLEKLKGLSNIVQLFEVVRKENTILIFELVNSLDIEDFFDELDSDRLKWLIKNLLIAAKGAHSKGIVHRDIKLGNIMVSEDFTQFRLIDWGCGAYVTDYMSSKAGSRTCRSPEMLLGCTNYGTACDDWAVGAFIFFILTDGELPWKAKTSSEALIKMSKIFGGENILKLAEKYSLEAEDDVINKMYKKPKRSFEYYFAKSCDDLVDPKLVDLMKKLLTLDPENRYTIDDALNHPYFA
jgi:casein kinase II subunit alpha